MQHPNQWKYPCRNGQRIGVLPWERSGYHAETHTLALSPVCDFPWCLDLKTMALTILEDSSPLPSRELYCASAALATFQAIPPATAWDNFILISIRNPYIHNPPSLILG